MYYGIYKSHSTKSCLSPGKYALVRCSTHAEQTQDHDEGMLRRGHRLPVMYVTPHHGTPS